MAIFPILGTKNADGDSQTTTNNDSTKSIQQPSTSAARPTAGSSDDTMQFDDDMAYFVTHLDADPLAETHLKMQLVEQYYPYGEADMIREIPDDEDDYT
jgi:hypothetical protein